MRHVTIMGIPFLHTNQQSFVDLLDQRIQRGEKTFVITANPEVVMKARKDTQFMQHVQRATYVVADGIGVVKAASLLKQPLPERVTGFDTMIHLLEIANKKHYRIFLLGAQNDTLQKTVKKIEQQYPNIKIVGAQDGYFNWESNEVADSIAKLQPDITFVALGCPRQENWIANNLSKFNQGVFIGVGGSFDGIAGTVKRAPVIFQKLNLEWFYRLLKQPSRWKRMLALPEFAILIMKQKLKGKTHE
ncbi:WecB/TagA/CpsF family glycosyltransferase [Virgibacillus pantothenticus]|uniref:WecB/TagA/CpsF family glycosyltransferase n=1 Tax=Virgibacillus pantothenticus TaxID=1473 RepID=UPI003D290F12